MDQLKDLLKHEIKDLYSAEEQLIEALPKMIEKANNKKLKQALQEHFTITEMQKERLDEVLELLEGKDGETKGFLSGLFKDSKDGEKCKAMEGLITEGEKLMKEDMTPEVSDAAIIAAAQKIEHYEISSYGTARAYAQELNLDDVEALLKETLDEEYQADDVLTEIAEGRVNAKANNGSSSSNGRSNGRSLKTSSPGRSNSSKRGKTSSNGRAKTTTGNKSKTSSSKTKRNTHSKSSSR